MVTDLENLRGFAREIMENWPRAEKIDGKELQDLAIKYGLIKQNNPTPNQPCGPDCLCADSSNFGRYPKGTVQCFERTELLRGL